jgi:hypothetical protein
MSRTSVVPAPLALLIGLALASRVDAALTASPTWTDESNQAFGRFGWSVAPAGDVNGDGFSDVIVGAPGYAHPAGQLAGAAFVYYGTATGLASTPAWSAPADSKSPSLGWSVAPAGDVNGDGYADVIISTPDYSNGQASEGAAFVYHGSASGLGATPAWTVEGNQVGADFGYQVSTAGDVNGDGYSDVIVGAPSYDGNQADEGMAFAYLGSATGLATTPAWTVESNQSGSSFGIAVATAGDVNGDGYADVIVGASRYTNGHNQEGRVYVYRGSVTGLLMVPQIMFESNRIGALFGSSVAAAGDVNGDGYADVIVGAPAYEQGQIGEGMAFVYPGSAAGTAASFLWSAEGNQVNAGFGGAVATAGDVNGDGFADVVVGASAFDNGEANEGRASVYPGRTFGVSSIPIWTSEADQPDALFGFSAATAGDVDGDGFSDLIVGAQQFSNPEGMEGRASVYRGSGDGLAPSAGWTAEPDQAGAGFGGPVASAGDVNGDGHSDFLVAAPQFDNGGQFDDGRVFAYLGSALAPVPSWTIEANQSSAFMGFTTGAAGAGDVNGDGYGDVIVGAPFYDNGEADEGRVWIHAGSASGLSAAVHWMNEVNEANAHYGISVAGAGDVNGDGYGDVIVGAEQASNGEAQEGRAYVYHGSPAGLTLAWTGEPNLGGSSYGHSVASAGDVNGDGYSDVIVGAERYSGGQNQEGRAYVYLGSAAGLSATPAWTAESNQALAQFGHTVASAGDVNGDGYSDVIVGADLYDNGQGNEGRAEIYLGSAAGLSPTAAWTVESNQIIAGVNMSVAGAGDVNGDGFSDVVVGYPQFSNGQASEGIAYLYLGGPGGPDTTPDWSAESNQASAFFGTSVASAGDVNGDGFSEVLVGAISYDNGHTNEGRATLYYGNLDRGPTRTPRQVRTNQAVPIALLGESNDESSFRLKAWARTAAGRGNVHLEIEAKPLGAAFDGTGTVVGAPVNTGVPLGSFGSALDMSQLVGGLVPATPYRWRLRAVSANPFFPTSSWASQPGNAPSETDLRTRDAFERQLSVADAFVVEGNAGTTQMTFTVSINPLPLTAVTVDYATSDGTATAAGGDYDATSGTITFQPQQASAPITVTVHGDLEFEFNETLTMTLSNPSGATLFDGVATGNIEDDGDPSNVTICPDLYVTDQRVNAVVEQDGILYLGGNFTEVGPPTGCALPFDAATGAGLGIPRVDGNVFAVAPDGSGGWYVGGNFSTVGGLARSNIAHVKPDHTPSAWNPGANAAVTALAVTGNIVYAGGSFTAIGGQARSRVAALDRATGNATGWSPSPNGNVEALAVSGGSVYLGGSFTMIGTGDHKGIAAVDIVTGTPKDWLESVTGTVRAIVPSGGVVYVGGNFTFAGGESRQNVAALDTTNGLATPWDPNATHQVRSMALGTGVLYVGGDFTSVGGELRSGVAAIDLATGLATGWNPSPDGSVLALATSGSAVYAGGAFRQIGGAFTRYLAALDPVTGAATAWSPRPNDQVRALAFAGGVVYAGGVFSSAGGSTRNGLAALDLSTGTVTAWNPNVGPANSFVTDMEIAGNLIYAGGGFGTIGGAVRNNIAAIDRTTGLATAWNPNANQQVIDLCVAGGLVYAGGVFGTIGGASRNHIAALDAVTGFATPWNPDANSQVAAIAVSNGIVYVGGYFTSISAAPFSRIAALDAETAVPVDLWNPLDGADDAVLSLLVANGVLYVGGGFTFIGAQERAGLAALELAAGTATEWTPLAGGPVLTMAAANGALYVGGNFLQMGGQTVPFLASLDPVTGKANAWKPGPSGTVNSLLVRGAVVFAGGWFETIGGTAHSHIACIRPAGSTIDVPIEPVADRLAFLGLRPNPATGPARIEYLLPQAGHVRISVYDVRGRLVARPVDAQKDAGRHAEVWNAEGTNGRVASGIYFVRMEVGAWTATQRLVHLRE